jgi:hypothetical protein
MGREALHQTQCLQGDTFNLNFPLHQSKYLVRDCGTIPGLTAVLVVIACVTMEKNLNNKNQTLGASSDSKVDGIDQQYSLSRVPQTFRIVLLCVLLYRPDIQNKKYEKL